MMIWEKQDVEGPGQSTSSFLSYSTESFDIRDALSPALKKKVEFFFIPLGCL
jgi:hypothetical protein